jgi:hypothetical protein
VKAVEFSTCYPDVNASNLSTMAYVYRERTRWCARCKRETIHWRETTVEPGRWPGLLGCYRWLIELAACRWYCRRCTREPHIS